MIKFQKTRIVFMFFIVLSAVCASGAAAMPDDMEIKIGRKVKEIMKARFAVYENKEIQKYVEHVGLKIVSVCQRQDMVYHFVLLDTNRITAMASPGGYIYISKGILANIESEAELAAVLGQKIAHIAKHHCIERLEKDMKFVRGSIEAVPVLADTKTVSGKSDAFLRGVNAAYAYTMFGYGKKLETEADINAVEYLLLAGYDTSAMIKFLDLIQIKQRNDLKLVMNYIKMYPKTTKRVDIARAIRTNLRARDPDKFDSLLGNDYKDNYKKSVLDILNQGQ